MLQAERRRLKIVNQCRLTEAGLAQLETTHRGINLAMVIPQIQALGFFEFYSAVFPNARLLDGLQFPLEAGKLGAGFLVATYEESRRPEEYDRHTSYDCVVGCFFILHTRQLGSA